MTEQTAQRALAREAEKKAKADGRKLYKLVSETKAQVFELEKQNDRYIYVFRSKGNWWKMGGMSALFYTYVVSEKLAKRQPKLLKDSDHYSTFKEGIVSKQDLKALAEELKKIGMKLKKISTTIYRFEFEQPVDPDVISNLLQSRKVQNEKANKLVDTKMILPKLHLQIRELMTIIWYYINKHRKNMAQAVILPGLLENAMDLKRTYSRASNGFVGVEEGLAKIMLLSNDMLADVAFLKEIDELDMVNCNKIQNKLGEIIHQARTEITKIERKKREKLNAKDHHPAEQSRLF